MYYTIKYGFKEKESELAILGGIKIVMLRVGSPYR